MSEQDRQRLKEEYKDHYKKIREAKEQLKQAQRQKKMSDALHGLQSGDLFEVFDEMLYKIKHKITSAEARLEVALDDLDSDERESSATNTQSDTVSSQESENVVRRQRAKDTIRQVKAEMGMLYTELEEQASKMNHEKTIGHSPDTNREDQEQQ
jgi:poly-D-alanine transfer protein DltD